MKKILLFAFLICSFSAFAQYPAQPTTKQELGRQTTGDGLIYRGSGAPAYTPVNNRNAWIYYDTTNNRLYKSRLGSWSLMIQDTSAFNEIQMSYIVNDTLYLTQNVTGEPLTRYINRVWPIAALSDTTTITGEQQGDVAFVTGGTAVAFRGSAYWNPFSGGGGGSFDDFILAADSGSPATITDGQTVTIAGGTGLSSVISSNTVTTNLDNTAITAGTYGSATQVGQTTYDAQGRATGATNISILLPISAITLLPDSLTAKITRITSTNNYIPRWVGTSMGNSYLSQNAAGVVLDANLTHRITGGTTASRPTGSAGMMYYNTSNNWFDLRNGTSWFNPLRSATATGLGTSTHVGYFDTNGLLTGSGDVVVNTFGSTKTLRATALGTGVTANVNPVFFPVSTDFGIVDQAGRNISFYSYNTDQHSNVTAGAFNFYGAAFTATSGTQNTFLIAKNFTPTSGTATHASLFVRPTINQTGGANGITRGLYILPTLTSAADWRGIEVGSNSGKAFYQSGASAINNFAGNVNIGSILTPNRTLQVTGEVRITDLTTDTPTRFVGADADGDLAAIVATITAGGTTGDRTINELAGTVNIAAAGTTVTVTNSLVTANSLVFCTLRTNDTTATVKNVVPTAGGFTINLGAAATGEVSIGFFVVN